MTTVDYDFLKNELDYEIETENDAKVYKDYYYKICQYIYEKNAFRPTPSDIEEWLEYGYFLKASYMISSVKTEAERKFMFKRGIGLQIIYDRNNGRNTMINGTDGQYDITREAKECFEMCGLIVPVRW